MVNEELVKMITEEKGMPDKKDRARSWKDWVSRTFFGLWSFLFLFFAYWQVNDPDPEIWMSIYIFAAVMCALAVVERFLVPVLVGAAVAGISCGLYFFPSSVWDWVGQEWQQADLSMKTINMEEARESFGLLIFSAIMLLASYRGWLVKQAR